MIIIQPKKSERSNNQVQGLSIENQRSNNSLTHTALIQWENIIAYFSMGAIVSRYRYFQYSTASLNLPMGYFGAHFQLIWGSEKMWSFEKKTTF